MAECTPGPWRVRENPRNDQETCDLSICGDIFVLADLTGPQYAHQLPNARLMAAAPELLAALQEIVAPVAAMQDRAKAEGCQLDGMMAIILAKDPEYLRGIARAAIAKAECAPIAGPALENGNV